MGGAVKRELALSEVIGFLMIVSLLAILFSMYMLYVVPLQGRDAEIAHMDQVKEQFTGIKLDIDSLIVNQKLGYPIQRMISLGSGSGGQGNAMSFIPMQTYSGSSGTLMVDDGTNSPELGRLRIILNGTGVKTVPEKGLDNAVYYQASNPLSGTTSEVSIDPQHFYLNYNVAATDPANTSDIINISSNSTDSMDWSAIIRVIPRYDPEIVNVTASLIPGDLTLTIKKGANTSIDNLTLVRGVDAGNNPYPVDLYDWSYGLADTLNNTFNYSCSVYEYPYTPNPTETKESSIGQTKYTPIEEKTVTSDTTFGSGVTHPLSLFSYRSQNKNFVNQEYLYQWGASFVNQSDGTSLLFTPPVSIQMVNGVIQVSITDIDIKTHSDFIHSSSVGGTQNNPVLIWLSDLNSSINGYELLDGQTNAKYVIITAGGFDANEQGKWYKVFNTVAENAKRSSSGYLSLKNIVATVKPVSAGETSASLFICNGPSPFNLSSIVQDGGYPTLQDVIDELNDKDGVNDITINDLKISYKKANVSVSLFNIGQ